MEWAQIFNVDIFQFAGLAFLLLVVFRKFNVNCWWIFALGIIMNIAGTLLDGYYTDSYVINQFLGFFYPTPTCCCFPLMNWFIFVAAGNVMGWIYCNKDIEKYLRILVPMGIVLTAVYMYLCLVVKSPLVRALQNDWGLYSMHTLDAILTTFGIAPFMLGFFTLLSKAVPQKLKNLICYPSRHISQFYCISWVLIMWTANIFLFVPKATTEVGFVLIWFIIVILTTIVVIIYNRYFKARLSVFFSSHSTILIIGIWTSLLLFGIWFFFTVYGPYTMPY